MRCTQEELDKHQQMEPARVSLVMWCTHRLSGTGPLCTNYHRIDSRDIVYRATTIWDRAFMQSHFKKHQIGYKCVWVCAKLLYPLCMGSHQYSLWEMWIVKWALGDIFKYPEAFEVPWEAKVGVRKKEDTLEVLIRCCGSHCKPKGLIWHSSHANMNDRMW
jgi:hypothetical protein